jgi:hypothetical protein
MTFQTQYLSKTFFMAACFTIGCTGSGMAGCGSDGGSDTPTVDSDLIGVYAIDSFQASTPPASCDELSDSPTNGNFVVIYSFVPNDDRENPRLGGVFCATVEDCEDVASRAPEPTLGYSFIEGNDEAGWTGYAIVRTSQNGQMCVADVQIHDLTGQGQSITIGTNTVETEFEADIDGDQATCAVRDALNSITPDMPCKSRLLLEGTRNAN